MNSRAEAETRWADFRRRMYNPNSRASLHLLILAAHPDDETIGASLLLARFPQAKVVFLTDGAPHDPRFWSRIAKGSREDYAQIRRQEAEKALAVADVFPQQIAWLGAADQGAIFDATRLTNMFAEIVDTHRPDIVITHPYEGGHPDHDAAALIARMAISAVADEVLLVEMTSYHAQSGNCVTGEFLDPGANEMVCELTDEARGRKRRMMDEYVSQRGVLDGFRIDHERFRCAPAYDFSQAPHHGRLWYECMDWPMTGRRWRELASAAIREMQERHATHSA